MKIRVIKHTDFSQIYVLWQEAGLWVHSIEKERSRFDEMLHLYKDLCFLIEDNKKIIGTILGGYDGRAVGIHRLVVKPGDQKKGYGKLLIQKLEQAVKEKGMKKIVSQVHISNIKVLDFYKKLGYQEDHLITLKKELG